METKVISLALSKKLDELGFKRESEFYYVTNDNVNWSLEYSRGYEWTEYPAYCDYKYKIPAYLSCELGEALPIGTSGYKHKKGYVCEEKNENYFTDAETESDARASMVAYLLELGIIKTDV